TRRSFRRRLSITEGVLRDETGSVKITWFNQPYLATNLKPGDRLVISGKVSDRGGMLQFASPAYERIGGRETIHTGRLVPMYPTTAGLTQRQLRYFVSQALRSAGKVLDPLPEELRTAENLPPLAETLQWIHFPRDERERDRALERLKFDELLLFQLQRLMDEQRRTLRRSPVIPFDEKETKAFVASLPFQLTNGQRRAAWDILQDMTSDVPMNRLLEGDVGSGKTVVAAIAALNALRAGFSVALMAPTEILARQHFLTFRTFFSSPGFTVALRTHTFREESGGRKKTHKHRQEDARITIGTHALLHSRAELGRLGLVLIDEQHRFGVDQRRMLQSTSGTSRDIPHLLSLTATPIPRSLALTLAGDLRLSVLRTMPQGRAPTTTRFLSSHQRDLAYRSTQKEIANDRQAFIIAPLIEPSDILGVASATTLHEDVVRMFPKYRIGLLHGKMPGKEKDATLLAFARHELDVLVATPVVEVGIDIPNATVMVIEGAERFGLAQLHQLRGRIGRGIHPSACFLLSNAETPLVRKRLSAVTATRDGFALAELDLKLRGPGDLVGTEQSGFLDFRFATLGDHALMEKASAAAQRLLRTDPSLSSAPLLLQKLRTRKTLKA
ncbi:MAG: ATP-dependent DNA helicase RecG, partial [bacterium]